MRVNVGDVVLVDYTDYQGVRSSALFVVYYHECFDKYTSNAFNALKISTNPRMYQIPINKNYANFLKHDSYINCNEIFRFSENEVKGILGKLSPYYLRQIFAQVKSYHNKVEKELSKLFN